MSHRRADKTPDFVDGFFRRYPKLSKYRSHLRFREREQGGSAGHGEARQHGNEVWLFPKFWQHPREVQDFVLAHEVGHWVKSEFGGREFIALAESNGIDPWDSPGLPFGQFNMDEAFADAFASYYTDGDVKRRYPAWAQLVEAVEAGERPARVARKKKSASVGKHTLPKLPYPYDALEPHVSEETLRQHHDKHHKAYVDGLNKAEKALAGARDDGDYEAVPALNAALQFHAGGHHLHSLYWPSLTPPSDYEGPSDALVAAVARDFGSWDAFRAQLKESMVKVRGSGWGVLVLTPAGLRVVTVMNHENGVLWGGVVLLPIDAWEHAYYLDYQSDREAHFDAVFDNLVKWSEVERRLQAAQGTVQKKQARAVAARYFLHQEVRRVCASRLRVASREGEQVRRELTPEVMLAFVEASGVRVASMKVALDMVKKVKQLWEAFTSQPGAWERFKRVIGVKADGLLGALKELPRKIAELGKKGSALLHKLGGWLTEHVPFFRIYSEARGKMPALNTYLLKLVDYLPPRVAGALKAVGKKAHDLAAVLDEYVEKHPVALIAGTGASAALFTVIWLNVTEISWDLGDLVRGFLGMYSFAELLKSLPEAGVGLLLSLMFPGLPSRYLLNALLPVTVALRVAWLVGQHYASWEHGSLVIHWEKLGLPPPNDELLLAPA